MTGQRRGALLGFVTAVLVITGCGGADDASPDHVVEAATAHQGLCDARGDAVDGDLDRAVATFGEEAHDALHRLHLVLDDSNGQLRLQETTTALEDVLAEGDAQRVSAALDKAAYAVSQLVPDAELPGRCDS